MLRHSRRVLWGLAILASVVSTRSALGDLYKVLVGEAREKPSAVFVADPGVPMPDLDVSAKASLLEQRAVFGGRHLPVSAIDEARGMYAEQVRATEIDASGVHRWTLYCRMGSKIRTFQVYENQRGEVFVKSLADSSDPGKALVFKVHRGRFVDLLWSFLPGHGGPRPQPKIDPALPAPGTVGDLPKPAIFGGVLFNEEKLRSDFMFGSSSIAGTARTLASEKFFVRLPKGYSPSVPAGVLVWIDGDSIGTMRPELFEALDAFNIVGVSAQNSGNDRPLADRVQLAFDALASVRSRVLVDERRIYVGGISGGGRVSTMVALAFPDTFRACLAIVGVNSCYNVRLPDGKQVQRSSGVPTPHVLELLKNYKIAAMTGSEDFNRPEILARSESFKRIKVDCKVFDTPGMGHQMPKPKDIQAAVDWFDQVSRNDAETRLAHAESDWKKALAALPATGELTENQRRELFADQRGIQVSPSAWEALHRAYPKLVAASTDAKEPPKTANP